MDGGDNPCDFAAQCVFHFHGLHNDQGHVRFHSLPDLHLYLGDPAGHGTAVRAGATHVVAATERFLKEIGLLPYV